MRPVCLLALKPGLHRARLFGEKRHAVSLNNLVGGRQQRFWDGEAERLGSIGVENGSCRAFLA
jgi:hypothetical protein